MNFEASDFKNILVEIDDTNLVTRYPAILSEQGAIMVAACANAKLREWMDFPDMSGPFLEIVEKQIREDERRKLLEKAPVVHVDRFTFDVMGKSKDFPITYFAKLVDIQAVEIGEGE